MDSEEENHEAVTDQPPVRKTRSGRIVRPPPAKNIKTSGRKSKKKVVLMEVEVSDEEDHQDSGTVSDSDEKNKNGDDCDTSDFKIDETANVSEPDNVNSISSEENNIDEEVQADSKGVSVLEEAIEFNIDELRNLSESEGKMQVDDNEEQLLAKNPDETESIDGEEVRVELIDAGELLSSKNEDVAQPMETDVAQPMETDVTDAKATKDYSESISEELNQKEDVEIKEDQEVDSVKNELKTETENPINPEPVASPKKEEEDSKEDPSKENGDPDTENISEDELPGVQVAKVPETEEVSDDELPGPKRAELPADTEVVSEDELPAKESGKRKLEDDYDPGSPTSESETPAKKPALDTGGDKEKDEKPKPKKLPELDKYWKAVNDDPTDFTGWTYLLQYVDQENDMEAAREAYDAFLSHYPYCYGYWRKYADYEKRKGNKKKCEEVFERGFKAIPLSVDLWIHYLTYVKTVKPDDEEFTRSQFERALSACGLEFRSDRLWESYIKWETEAKRLQRVTGIYDRLLATPTQGYTAHFESFQEHVATSQPNKVLEVDEFLALRKEVRHALKHDTVPETDNADAPPGDEDPSKIISTDEETKAIRDRIISIRRKIHKNTAAAVTARWNYEEGIKRPYFHVKPLERCQLKNWQDYLDYEIEVGDRVRTIVLFERCLIACALYEEFWLKFVHYLEGLKDPELLPKIRDVYERACTIHHLKKPNLHLQWAMFEETIQNPNKAAEILVNLEKSVPNVLQIAYRRINLERRRGDFEKCSQLFEHYINSSKNKVVSSNVAIKFARFALKILKSSEKAVEILKNSMTKDPNNPRLYLQLIDMSLQRESISEKEVVDLIDSFLEKDTVDPEQKVLFAQRKLEFLEDFGADIQSVQKACDDYQKYVKQNKESIKKKEAKSEPSQPSKKDSKPPMPSSSSNSYGSYGNYSNSPQGSYQYSGSQGQYSGYSQYQGDQYQYQGWQYPQGNYSGYNQWGSYGGGYGY